MSNVTGVAGWRVWYKGGADFDSGRHSWDQLPASGCVLVMVYFLPKRSTRRYMSGQDWYFRQPVTGDVIYGSIGSNSDRGRADVITRYPGSVVLEGEWVTDTEMSTIEAAAMASVAP